MHHRKVESMQREAAKKAEVKSEAARAKEDAKWIDDDKSLQQKQARAQSKEIKEAEEQRKRQEKKELIAKEEADLAKLGNKKGITTNKINRSDIKISALQNIQFGKPKKKEEPVLVNDLPLIPNMNRVNQEILEAGGEVIDARGINEALIALKITEDVGPVDLHPEKRQKAAYAAFEALRLPQLKEEFPTLKWTQYKDKLHREWQKHPDNPVADRNKK